MTIVKVLLLMPPFEFPSTEGPAGEIVAADMNICRTVEEDLER